MAIELASSLFPKENLSVVLYGKNDIRLEVWPLPEKLLPNEVLLKSHSTGICGTDIHLWRNAAVADFVVTKPYCLGHEPSAEVMMIGSEVDNLKVGDRVVVEPAIPCLRCYYCRGGRYNLCSVSNLQSHGLPSSDGSLRRYYTHRADFCYPLPDSVSLDSGALVEALAVVVHACRRVNVHVGHHVLVCGAGPVGLMTAVTAKAFGAYKVCVTDIKQSRLDVAKELGADYLYHIDVNKPFDEREAAKNIIELMEGRPDVTIECSGVETSQAMAIHATKSGGRVAIVGLGSYMNRVPLSTAAMREVDLIGVCRIKDDYPMAIKLIESGKIDAKRLITQKFDITEAMEAFKLMQSGSDEVIKILIQYKDN